MKPSSLRKLAAFGMLACIAAQPAVGSALVVSALTVGLQGNDHAHVVTVVSEDGHLHLVPV